MLLGALEGAGGGSDHRQGACRQEPGSRCVFSVSSCWEAWRVRAVWRSPLPGLSGARPGPGGVACRGLTSGRPLVGPLLPQDTDASALPCGRAGLSLVSAAASPAAPSHPAVPALLSGPSSVLKLQKQGSEWSPALPGGQLLRGVCSLPGWLPFPTATALFPRLLVWPQHPGHICTAWPGHPGCSKMGHGCASSFPGEGRFHAPEELVSVGTLASESPPRGDGGIRWACLPCGLVRPALCVPGCCLPPPQAMPHALPVAGNPFPSLGAPPLLWPCSSCPHGHRLREACRILCFPWAPCVTALSPAVSGCCPVAGHAPVTPTAPAHGVLAWNPDLPILCPRQTRFVPGCTLPRIGRKYGQADRIENIRHMRYLDIFFPGLS